MKKYIRPQIDVTVFSTDDVMINVLTSSGDMGIGNGGAEGLAVTVDFGSIH